MAVTKSPSALASLQKQLIDTYRADLQQRHNLDVWQATDLITDAASRMKRYTLTGANKVIYDTAEFEAIFYALMTLSPLR